MLAMAGMVLARGGAAAPALVAEGAVEGAAEAGAWSAGRVAAAGIGLAGGAPWGPSREPRGRLPAVAPCSLATTPSRCAARCAAFAFDTTQPRSGEIKPTSALHRLLIKLGSAFSDIWSLKKSHLSHVCRVHGRRSSPDYQRALRRPARHPTRGGPCPGASSSSYATASAAAFCRGQAHRPFGHEHSLLSVVGGAGGHCVLAEPVRIRSREPLARERAP